MKKVGIITMLGYENCGNRLQNYALQQAIKNEGFDVYTIKNDRLLNSNNRLMHNFLRYIKKEIRTIGKQKKFKRFNKNIKFSREFLSIKTNIKTIDKKYDFFVVGSDQIWKPTRLRMSYIDLLGFASPDKRIAYAPSFGLDTIDKKYYKILQDELPKFKAISVRENAGKEIIKDATGIDKVKVVLDPTMLLTAEDWERLEEKPDIINKEKFIFTYFLGDEETEQLKKQFDENELQFIDFYKHDFGPQEFLYLIHRSELVLTDSFHACVFSIIFNKKFYVFSRKQKETNNNMNSRMDTLFEIFNLKDRSIKNINEIDINKIINYKNINKILKEKKEESIEFLRNSLNK